MTENKEKSLEEILKEATKDEGVEISIYHNAVIKNLKAYQEEPTKANKLNLESAQEAFSKKKQELTDKYFPDMPSFKTLMEACEHLKRAGYKVSKTKLYRDKDSGKIKINADGSVLEAEIRAYAATYLDQLGPKIDDLSNIAADKADLERQKLKEQIEKLRFSRERDMGRYVLKEEVDLKMVGVLTVLDINFRQLVDLIMVDFCRLMNGDIRKINQAKDFFEQKMDDMLNKLAHTDSFTLIFEESEHDKDDKAAFQEAVQAELEEKLEELETEIV